MPDEDKIDTFTEVLGEPDTWEEKDYGSETGISQYQDVVFCTAYALHDDDIAGYVLRERNPAQNTNRERLYDKWNFTAGFSSIPMIRNQKTWFYKERVQFDRAAG